MQQLQQKDWCEQQVVELARKNALAKDINDMFDEQTIRHNNILKQTQDDLNKNRTQNEVDTDNINKTMA